MVTSDPKTKGMGFIIGASSVGTLIEWYDFYIFGMLATIISKQFFPEDSGTSALLSTLAIFAAGFIVRPFGALVFGRLGDKIGRKYTFLLTLVLMGGSTFAIGLVPGFKTIGWAAPILVLILRLIQGLALGGEYGGAATYVAEHAPANRRGYWTSWIQATATMGLFLALGVIILIRESQGVDNFSAEWGGWRYPFWISLLLVIVSILIRMRMSESPMFAKVKAEGKTSINPIKESFGHKANFKVVLLALFGAVMGQGVIWYTGQFYAQSFIENICRVNFVQSRNIMLVAILFATPFFIVFGALSDRIGRKWIMMTGMFLGIVCYMPIYKSLLSGSMEAKTEVPVKGDPPTRSITKLNALNNSMVINTAYHVQFTEGTIHAYTEYDTMFFPEIRPITTKMIGVIRPGITDAAKVDTVLVDNKLTEAESLSDGITYISPVRHALNTKPDIERTLGNGMYWKFIFLVFIQILFVTMVYGPMAAFLVELFPTKIRYTSMSLPYHIGNGVFGGLVPFLGTLLVELTKTPTNPAGNALAGLCYPIIVATLCLIIGAIYLPGKIVKDVID